MVRPRWATSSIPSGQPDTMADNHILPIGLDAASLSRRCEALRRRFEVGQDLGGRTHHIRMLHTSLEDAHRNLRQLIEAFRARRPVTSLETEPSFRSLEVRADTLTTSSKTIEEQTSRF
ncbi:hypothetical protein Mpop_0242 [Methylorubrum populi BJ001]|uniref:Uncharacterized protein n=2 Tax=Methylorubrum populi TaxID=223967 RepID=B1ZH23_METPB|nr:hypothetical protein Mpop_0242 [Methylorubrum populi BJ001]